MPFDAHANLAISTVATAPSPATSGASLVVASGQGARFPTPPFSATVWPTGSSPTPANAEIVRVTAISTDTLTITRAQEGTTARTVVIGDQIAAGITAKTLTDVEALARPLDTFTSVGSGDDFAGTALDGGWSSLQTTALTSIDRSVGGYCILKNTGNTSGQERGIQRAFAPAGDFELIGKVLGATLNANFQWTGIFVGASDPSDASGGNRIVLNLLQNNGVTAAASKMPAGVQTNVFSASLSSIFNLANVFQYPCWLRIKRVGTTLSFGISLDGVQFIDAAATTTISFTVATCGLLVAESTATANMRSSFDYIRTA